MGAPEPLTVIQQRYRLDALIGEGGMAGVWRAWDLTLQRPVAVKLLFARDARDENALVTRFLREARIAASVQHRNVIHIVDFGTTPENQPFMVMELLEGEALAARLRREKRLPVPDAVQIANLTLRGLSAVHAAGIIHRDLKPDNVYLKTEGGVVYPKILDFGISRSIDAASGVRSALTTRDGVIVGTPEYMSPEQARGMKRLDYRTDLYSMGVVLYEALTGRLPYRSDNVGDLIIKIVTGVAPKVHELAPEVPRPISDVVAQAMARNASDRFSDATAMQEALLEAATRAFGARTAQALSDLPPQPRDSQPGPWHLRATRRPPSPLPRTSAIAAAPIVAVTHPAPPPIGVPPSPRPLSAPSERAPGTTTLRTNWQSAWGWPLTAAGSLLAFGALILWLAPAAPRPAPVLPKLAAIARAPVVPAPIETVQLVLRGLPDNATVTLDGAKASSVLTLLRGAAARNISVTAQGKTPWHIAYVPNADQTLDVALSAVEPQPATAKTNRKLLRSKRRHKAAGALRVPDF